MKQDKEEANVFSIFVSYYVKIKCVMSGIPMVGKFSVKLPFVLMQPSHIAEQSDAPSPTAELRSRIRALTTRDALISSESSNGDDGDKAGKQPSPTVITIHFLKGHSVIRLHMLMGKKSTSHILDSFIRLNRF